MVFILMALFDVKAKVEQLAINHIIKKVESGKFGKAVQDLWFGLKGRKSIIGWSMFAIGGAISLWPSPETIAFGGTIATIGSYLGRFGLAVKGADQAPPPFPEEYRPVFEFVLSAVSYVCEALTAVAGLLMLSGSDKAYGVSLSVIVFGQALSTASAYLSTRIGNPPSAPAAAHPEQL